MTGQFVLPFAAAGPEGDSDFLVTESNRAVIERLFDWTRLPFGAAVLIGPAGSGKTTIGRAFVTGSGGCLIDNADGESDETLFHAWNRAQVQGSPVLFAAERPPAEWGIRLPDLLSRLGASLLVEIPPPDEEMTALLLQKRLARAGLALSDALAGYAALRVERSYPAIGALARKIDEMALAMQRPIGQRLVRDALALLAGTDGGSTDTD
ncbi:DnaA/Hda family protein [Blastomonas sp.]|uniref:DnaA ATPase domain-containing protein n=1 Tax=Blastomonas sp. TaxID=1909299 RepID=UPI00260C8DD1|nr:DnaA/Hda family protein [Blastomonas sp.]MDM7957770.1 DnaA/Hda family protein [Blastomonas sp.]